MKKGIECVRCQNGVYSFSGMSDKDAHTYSSHTQQEHKRPQAKRIDTRCFRSLYSHLQLMSNGRYGQYLKFTITYIYKLNLIVNSSVACMAESHERVHTRLWNEAKSLLAGDVLSLLGVHHGLVRKAVAAVAVRLAHEAHPRVHKVGEVGDRAGGSSASHAVRQLALNLAHLLLH
jgi:hypothetical protein